MAVRGSLHHSALPSVEIKPVVQRVMLLVPQLISQLKPSVVRRSTSLFRRWLSGDEARFRVPWPFSKPNSRPLYGVLPSHLRRWEIAVGFFVHVKSFIAHVNPDFPAYRT